MEENRPITIYDIAEWLHLRFHGLIRESSKIDLPKNCHAFYVTAVFFFL